MAIVDNYRYKIDPVDKNSSEKVKEESFTHMLITKSGDFDEWYKDSAQTYPSDKYVFRGTNEAKYKLFASLQRVWWDYDFNRALFGNIGDPKNYIGLLQILMDKASKWNDSVLIKYFEKLNVKLDDFALLSIMQHYGLPTPLLDFTTDLDIALYFAFLRMKQVPSNRLIDNCVSIYIINIEQNGLLNLSDIYKEQDDKKVNVNLIFEKKKIVYFSPIYQKYTPEDAFNFSANIYSNLNIVNQKGLFLFNYDPWKPIERNSAFPHQPYVQEIICIDIHKTLKEYVLYKIKERNSKLNDEYLFPNFDHFKTVTLRETLREFSPT